MSTWLPAKYKWGAERIAIPFPFITTARGVIAVNAEGEIVAADSDVVLLNTEPVTRWFEAFDKEIK